MHARHSMGTSLLLQHAARALHDMVAASGSIYSIDGYMQPCKRAHALSSLTTRRDWPAWRPGQTDFRSPYAPLSVPVLVNTPQ